MPGLLDYNTPPGGLMGSPGPTMQDPAPRPRRAGVMDVLGRIFGGMDNPALSEEQNAEARRQALIQAGLATLSASGQGGSSLGAIAQGALSGQAAGGQIRSQLGQTALRQRLRDLSESAPGHVPDLNTLRQMFSEAIAQGDQGSASAISEVIKAMEASASSTGNASRLMEVRGANGEIHLVNPQTGATVRTIAGDTELDHQDLGDRVVYFPKGHPERIVHIEQRAAPPGTVSLGTPQPYTDPVTGTTKLGTWNPSTGSFQEVRGALPATSSGEDARKAAGFLSFIQGPLAYIGSFVGTPDRVHQAASNHGLQEIVGPDQQRLKIAGNALAEAWLRMTTGAAYTERELQTAMEMFVPQPGDRRETLEMKATNRQQLTTLLRARAGLPGGPGGGTTPPARAPGDASRVDRSPTSLRPEARSAVERMIADGRAAGHALTIRETGRSQVRQDSLFDAHDGSTKTRSSNHSRGLAADLDGNPAAIAWARANARRYGLNTLGAWDPNHFELSSAAPLLTTLGGLRTDSARAARPRTRAPGVSGIIGSR